MSHATWHPVDECRPETHRPVLLCDIVGAVAVGKREYREDGNGSYWEIIPGTHDDGILKNEIMYWMPFPEGISSL